MARKHERLGEILRKRGLVKSWDLVNAINTSMRSDKRFGEILLERRQIDEETLAKCIAAQFGLEYIDLDETFIPPDALKLIPKEICKEECIIPIGMSERTLKLVVSDPTDQEMMDTLRFCLTTEVECYLASPTKIRAYLNKAFSPVEISEEPLSNPVDVHDCLESAHLGTGMPEDIAPNSEAAEIEGEFETQNLKEATAKKRHMDHFFWRLRVSKIIRRAVALMTISHIKKCKSCWIKNRIPTGCSDRYMSCKRCGSPIQVQPSVLALILGSVILLTVIAVAIWRIAPTRSLLKRDYSELGADANARTPAIESREEKRPLDRVAQLQAEVAQISDENTR